MRRTLAGAVLATTLALGAGAGVAAPAGAGPVEEWWACVQVLDWNGGAAAIEQAAYVRCTWPAYGLVVAGLALERHQRFVPLDPGWAAQEAEWWVNLSWADYAVVLLNTITAHHIRVVPR